MNIDLDVANDFKAGKIVVSTTIIRLSSVTELATFKPTRGVQIATHPNNTAGQYVLIGQADVNTTDDNGYVLYPDRQVFIPLRDLAKINLVASAASQVVHYIAL